jgi:hypothetical protein
MPIPTTIHVAVDRLPAAIEATAYFVRVRDDGVGGARLDGSGLQGLADRVAALAGQFSVDSPAGGGTLIEGHSPARDPAFPISRELTPIAPSAGVPTLARPLCSPSARIRENRHVEPSDPHRL